MKKSQSSVRTGSDRAITQLITNIPIVQEYAATGPVAKSYAYYRERFGRSDVPGILKCFATHPPLLDQMIALATGLLFTEGHLPRRVKEMIATYVSALNDCPYCVDSHASFLRTQGDPASCYPRYRTETWKSHQSAPKSANSSASHVK